MKGKLSALTLAMLPFVASSAMANAQIEQLKTQYAENSVIVVFKENASKSAKKSARNFINATVTDANQDGVDDQYKHLLNGRIAKFKLNGVSSKVAIERLSKHPAVKYVEPDYKVRAIGIPNDSRFGELWGMHNEGQTGGTADADIDAVEAWDISTGSRDVIVGVIDTGVDYTHPDLANNVWVNPNEIPGDGIDNDNNGYVDDVHGINAITNSGNPMDDQGHGTHVSGTIGAQGNDGSGVAGVNHEVSIIGCKFLDSSGSGSISDAIKCVDYMVGLKNAGVNVRLTNNSWGGGGSSQAMIDALTASENADILFIAAAGNGAYDNDASPSYPASYEHDTVMAVASTDHNDNMSSFSQWGANSVDIGAPGSAILSTIPGGGYDSFSGTSMATPHVAGAAALVLSVNPDLTAVELKNLLMSSGDTTAAMTGKTVSGKRLNVHQALLDADPSPSFKLSVTPSSQTIEAGENAAYTFTLGSIAEWNGTVDLSVSGGLPASLSAATAVPGEQFTLSVATDATTQWGQYSFTVVATDGTITKEQVVNLTVNPQGLADHTYAAAPGMAIPDNDATGISSVITVPDTLTIFNTTASVDIQHTWIGDLTVSLTSPQGTTVTLHERSGGNQDDLVQSYSVENFNTEVATGDWTLTVTDTVGADTGTLNSWSLTFSAIGDVAPPQPEAPVAGFNAAVDGLAVTFSNTSSDANNDIVSYAWDFGDGNVSDAVSPSHVYAASGTYTVSLTAVDATGLSHTTSQQITVSDVTLTLDVIRAVKSRLGNMRVDLALTGAMANRDIQIFRNGELIDTVQNVTTYRDSERRATGSTYQYTFCQGENTCSNTVTVNF